MHFQPELCRVTLGSIGDAVITIDTQGRVTFLNPVAEALAGWTLDAGRWTQDEAVSVPLEDVFNIINQDSHKTVEIPNVRAMRDGSANLRQGGAGDSEFPTHEGFGSAIARH